MYIQAVLQKNCDPFGNGPSVSLADRLLRPILHKRRRKRAHLCTSHHNTQPLSPAVKATSLPQAVARREEGGVEEEEEEF